MARKGDRLLPQKFGAGVARGFFLNGALRPVIKAYVHPEVTGLDNLADLDPPLILAANHSSHMDTPLILNSLPKELRHRTLVAAASDYFFSSRMLGLFVSLAIGAIPMDRRAASRQTMDKVDQLLEQNWCLVIYPEGSRTVDGQLYRGKTGIARLALSARAPIVPVGIVGTYNAMPAGRSWPKTGHVQVRFGKPLTFDRYRLGVADQLVLRAITDQVMYEIMMLTGQTYVDEYVSRAKARQSRAAADDRQDGDRAGPDSARRAGRRIRRGAPGLTGRTARSRPDGGGTPRGLRDCEPDGIRDPDHRPRGPGRRDRRLAAVRAAAPGPHLRAVRAPAALKAPPLKAPPPAGTDAAEAGEPQATAGVIEVERPPPSAGRMVRLRARLARSQSSVGSALLNLLSRDRLDDETWDEMEEVLITADVGVVPARLMVDDLRTKVKVLGARGPAEVRELLRAELLGQLGDEDRSLRASPHNGTPAVILMVGVNGTGKTTTCGKLARALIGDGETVLLGAADTFRAAAADQLQTWGERVGAKTVRADREGADPASVAFEAVSEGIETGVDAVIIDTAGRLHTKVGLMDELGKVKRVVEKKAPVDEVLLVLDATTGQNGLRQARVFAEVVDVTGIVLTKLDGTAKGGIVIAVQRELGVPVKLVGLGEGPDDLAPFDPAAFVDAILG